ncbi:MAG TPA: sulfite exporter TauE/SafE family protein [Pyrinomonadaceae bacterium]|jgi:ABC-type nickel/cobalt efflux system permease component RcnA
MKGHFYIFIAILFLAIPAAAHPLGNFSVNQYSRLEVEKTRVKIRYVLDMAEIPAFQIRGEIDADKNEVLSEAELNAYAEKSTPGLLRKLTLTLNDQPLEIRAESVRVSMPEGAGGLPTLRVEWNLSSDFKDLEAVNRVRFENENFADRLGWNEIVLSRAPRVTVFDSTGWGNGVTDELKAYPPESLDAPLAERTADFAFSAGDAPENARALQNRDGRATAAVQKDRLAELVNVPEITPAIVFFGLLLAFGLGAMHAMSPGHGKTVVGAYLVGARGTPKHAAFLGLTVTVTHTLGVFALGLVTLFASSYILPEKLLPFLSFVSGLLVLYIGLTMFKTRLFSALGWETAGHHGDRPHHREHFHGEHSHDPHHGHHSHDGFTHEHDGHVHSHLPPADISWKSLTALGISGGLLPCPSALVLMLSAISVGRVGYGFALTIAFSFGLAATLTAVGLLFLLVGKTLVGARFSENRVVKTLPIASAFVIACIGAIICYNSVA